MTQSYADPDLHVFMDDLDVAARSGMTRVVQPMRREGLEPLITGDGPWEGSAVCYPVVLADDEAGGYLMWYKTIATGVTCLARSKRGRLWNKEPTAGGPTWEGEPTNVVFGRANVGYGAYVVDVTGRRGAWPEGSRFAGLTYGSDAEGAAGLYAIWSPDGEHWERREPAVLPHQGDRHALSFDAGRGLFTLTCRRLDAARKPGMSGRHREIALWESADLRDWEYFGVVLAADENDPPGTQLYGMSTFRYGDGFIGLLEMYYEPIEKLDTQVAWSRDGRHWQRVGPRVPLLGLGGQGAWDSHWVVPALSPPASHGPSLWFWYNGASTKHGSKEAHVRSIGLASLRQDGFVALETGRRGGELVTADLPAERERALQVNADARTGEIAVEVLDSSGTVLEGYGMDQCRVDGTDGVRMAVSWGDRTGVPATDEGVVKLRIRLRQGALYSYRWAAIA